MSKPLNPPHPLCEIDRPLNPNDEAGNAASHPSEPTSRPDFDYVRQVLGFAPSRTRKDHPSENLEGPSELIEQPSTGGVMDYQIPYSVSNPIPACQGFSAFDWVDCPDTEGISSQSSSTRGKTMTFAERLKIARARAKISQESLAHKCGVTKASISKFELGLTANPAMDTLFKLADMLQVDPRWLATGKSELAPEGEAPVLRFDANKALATLPSELREPILQMIESASKASEQRYWAWVKEKEG